MNNEQIRVEEFEGLTVPKKNLEQLGTGVWMISTKGRIELIVDYVKDNEGINFKTLSVISGHAKIIDETRYMEDPRLKDNPNVDYRLFKRLDFQRFIKGAPGYIERSQTIVNAGYDIDKLGGGFDVW